MEQVRRSSMESSRDQYNNTKVDAVDNIGSRNTSRTAITTTNETTTSKRTKKKI
jgi:hypothetical protein